MKITGLLVSLGLPCCFLNQVVSPQDFYGGRLFVPQLVHFAISYFHLNLFKRDLLIHIQPFSRENRYQVSNTLLKNGDMNYRINQRQFTGQFQLIINLSKSLQYLIRTLIPRTKLPLYQISSPLSWVNSSSTPNNLLQIQDHFFYCRYRMFSEYMLLSAYLLSPELFCEASQIISGLKSEDS